MTEISQLPNMNYCVEEKLAALKGKQSESHTRLISIYLRTAGDFLNTLPVLGYIIDLIYFRI